MNHVDIDFNQENRVESRVNQIVKGCPENGMECGDYFVLFSSDYDSHRTEGPLPAETVILNFYLYTF